MRLLEEPKTVAELIREFREEVICLFRQEAALARQETVENLRRLGRNTGLMAAGVIVAGSGVLVLLGALAILAGVLLSAAGMAPAHAFWVGPAFVGAAVAGIGGALCMRALKTLRNGSLTPRRTIETLKEEREWMREKSGR